MSCEVDAEALRALKNAFPDVLECGDVRNLSREMLETVRLAYPSAAQILLVAGFPCQDNSALKGKYRKGLRGRKSRLVWRIIALRSRVGRALRRKHPRGRIHSVLESVPGTKVRDRQAASAALGSHPHIHGISRD